MGPRTRIGRTAEDVWQLGYSVVFVAILLSLYGFHSSHFDTLDSGSVGRETYPEVFFLSFLAQRHCESN